MRDVAVFVGASFGTEPVFAAAARAMGAELAARGCHVWYGAGGPGCGQILVDALIAAGGSGTGIAVTGLSPVVLPSAGSTTVVVGSVAERTALMARNAGGCIALPGGVGTADEVLATLVLIEEGLIPDRPIAVLDVGGFGSALRTMFSWMAGSGFLAPTRLARLRYAATPAEALHWIEQYHASHPVLSQVTPPRPTDTPLGGLG